jgi:hypothetical protein
MEWSMDSIWNGPYGVHGIHPFHMESIWNVPGSVKYWILEQNLINKAVLKLRNQTDVCARKTMVAIPVAIVRHALLSLRWEKPLPLEDNKGIPVHPFLCNHFFFGSDIRTKLLKYVEPKPVIKVEEEDFAVEFNSPQHHLAFIDYLDLTVDD